MGEGNNSCNWVMIAGSGNDNFGTVDFDIFIDCNDVAEVCVTRVGDVNVGRVPARASESSKMLACEYAAVIGRPFVPLICTRNSPGDNIENVNFLRRHLQPLLRSAPRKLPNSVK